ncbi:MAG: V-type ATP synthase subunit I [Candidatus Nanohaloarchaea archaeon]|nr:V-type ATP synthase subunit I [Candidatus Nanohaloarchaea archaeon]
MLQTRRMEKISITGPKSQLQDTIQALHRLGVLDIDDYNGEYDEHDFQVGSPGETADRISSVIVKLRSVLSKLPEVETDEPAELDDLDDLREQVEDLSDEIEDLQLEREELQERKERKKERLHLLRTVQELGLDPDDFQDYENLDIHLGTVDDLDFREALPEGRHELYRDGKHIALFIDSDEAIDDALRNSGFEEQSHEALYDFSGNTDRAVRDLKEDIAEIEAEQKELRAHLRTLAQDNRHYLEANEKEWSRELEKAEAPLRFATSDNAFIAEGWIPADQFDEVRQELDAMADGKIHIQREEPEDNENPPVEHENPGPVEPFESLTDLVAVPRYSELDPSAILLLTFPLFFGFMIGDAGYGLTSFLVFYGGMRMFPEGKNVFISLMYASAATFLFGLAFGDAFGYVIFGKHSALAALTGIELFRQIPVLFHRAEHLSAVLPVAAAMGVFHVNLGFLLGAYQEYRNHGFKAAFLEKGSWIALEISAVAWYFQGMTYGAPLAALSVIMLYLGEGIEGVVEIPSLLSNILSYLRIFGVAVAAVSLAAVVNALASPLFATGTLLGLAGGTLVLMIGHTFNTFIKIMEGFLQGIRLHYVELFTKFYEGGGRRYQPFGSMDE